MPARPLATALLASTVIASALAARPAVSRLAPANAVDSSPAQFQEDEAIRWEPFALPGGTTDLTAQLGHLRVPQRRFGSGAAAGAATGSTAIPVDLAFVRLRSIKPGTGAPVVYLAGGPGQDATSIARFAPALASMARMARHADVILLDQRGTGMSTPRPICLPTAPLSPIDRYDPQSTAASRLDGTTARIRACVEEWNAKGVDARAFTNRENAADVDALRRALGVPKISLYGFSYGTHLALDVLHDFPGTVERVALIGTAGPDDLIKLPSISDLQFAKLSMLAGQSPAIGRDVPDMNALLRTVLATLDATPMPVTVFDRSRKTDVTVEINGDALRSTLVLDLGDGNDFPVFPALLRTVERGDASILSWFIEKRYNEVSGAISLMPYAMRCSAGISAEAEMRRRAEAATSPFRNAVNSSFPDVCAAFPSLDNGDRYRAPMATTVPVLFISGTLDNNTPPFQAEKLRWGMPNARHLIVQNAGHEDLQPIADVQLAVEDWLRGIDVSGRTISLPLPTFLSIEDARKDRKRSGR